MKRSSRACTLTALLGAAWVSAPAFVGIGATPRQEQTAMHGYRLDNMLEKKQGDGTLDVSEGFWIGERGFMKSQNAQGFRYRMRATPEEVKNGIETPGIWQLGPFKIKLGEAFGGTGNNDKLRDLKRKLFKEGLNDPKKIEENEYWVKRYGHKRWTPKYINQSGAKGGEKGLLRGLAAWSGYDPLNEERGKTWIEADYGKPWVAIKGDVRLPGYVSKEQMEKEMNSGKLLKK
eukprot:gb/GFBE01068188.1/.p1 GENE.gb/GFBE01068188.1/~~gb/GFBE01068188.1/.p1  ORF type:complete len:232 (+),score=88.24 gb/GFBE01068188.1/:1-696(+)